MESTPVAGDSQAPLPIHSDLVQPVWIEKTIVRGRRDREAGEFAIGKALWSPQASSSGSDIYRFMRDVKPGDIVLHFTDNEAFTGISEVARGYETFGGVSDTEWGTQQSYLVPLANFRSLEPPLRRRSLFEEEPTRQQLRDYLRSGVKNLFFNDALALNQGAYLTPARPELVRILNGAYKRVAGRSLVEALGEAQTPVSRQEPSAISLDDLAKLTLWKREDLRELAEAVTGPDPHRQIVLAGPPGTGKTWVAKQLVKYLTGDDQKLSRLAQFHPSFSYEQFMEGMSPVLRGGVVTFEVRPGLVLEIAESCRQDPRNHYLIIDEMNRANLSRVLGELMFLFEYRDQPMNLSYTKGFSLPPNLFFVATMNTADRSIRSIDSAIRRRFIIFDCPPQRHILESYYQSHSNAVPTLFDGFDALNEKLEAQLDRHHTIGHTFFMRPRLTRELLGQIWNRQIYPLIEEYFFDRSNLSREFSLDLFWP